MNVRVSLKISLIFLGSIFMIGACKVREKSATQSVQTVTTKSSFDFPLEWIGKYMGSLYIINTQNDTTQVPMQLIIDYPNAEGFYPWTLIYGEEDYRYYGLEAVNPDRGHYRIDEYNSIKLDGYVFGNHFISRFGVQGSDLIVDYERTCEGVEIQFYISPREASGMTGGNQFGQDTIPLVYTYPVQVYQHAVLKKDPTTP